MSDTATNEITALERQYWKALQDVDIDTILSLTDDPCIVVGAQGTGNIDHATYRKMMSGGTWKLDSFDLSDMSVRLLSDDVAITAYKVREVMTVDGQSLTLDAADSSTWIRRNGHWLCALHTESILGDPFGRDRKH